MTHITTNIHHVRSVHVKSKGQLSSSKTYTTDITIYDEDGGRIAITLFHDEELPITTEVKS